MDWLKRTGALCCIGEVGAEVILSMEERVKVLGTIRSVWKEVSLSVRVKMVMFESIAVLTVVYGFKAWALNTQKKARGYLRCEIPKTICGMRWVYHVRNNIVNKGCGRKHSMIKRADQDVPKWFRHMERKRD